MNKIVLYEIPEHPGYYATREGFLYSLKGNGTFERLVKGGYKGYRTIKFSDGETEYVHRVIAKVFVENPFNKPEVDHIDANPRNNRADNLRWVDRKENSHNTRSLENYKISNRKKARDAFLFSPDVIPIELTPMDSTAEMLMNLEIGSIYRVPYGMIKYRYLTSLCSSLKKKGYQFKTLNYKESEYSLVKRIK